MDFLRRQGAARRCPVQALQHLARLLHAAGLADYAELVAAAVDLHTEALLQLPQVIIELPAQLGQAFVVRGFQRDIDSYNFV